MPSQSVLRAINATGIADTRTSGDEASGIVKHGEVSNGAVKWKTQFYMMIHVPGGDSLKMCLCKLDTGSSVDALSEQVVKDLGVPMRPYLGPKVTPLGDPIQPIGQLTLHWNVRKRDKTYKTDFVVLDDHSSRGFDALLSDKEIGRIGFYTVNDTVWYVDRP